ncbi:hypothetical protein [Nitratireductor sp. CH_MIT9313-5]|uniref:hypothetical protein n=1 Tax=Nitratireductor sp. CH_MIT9313-5 TaxID=3107764 RepID=UPI00300893C7
MTYSAPDTESQAQFARRIGVSRQYVHKLVSQGLPISEDGRVEIKRALKWVRANVSTKAGSDDGVTLTEAKTQLLLLQAHKAELEVEQLEGSLIDKGDALTAVRTFARMFRDHVLRFPNRYGPELAATYQIDARSFVASLDEAIRRCLTEEFNEPLPFQPNDGRNNERD